MKPSTCRNPETGKLIHHYELGQLTDSDRDRFEEHLLECDFCASEVERMFPVASTMAANREAIRQGLAADGITVAGLRRQFLAQARGQRHQAPGERFREYWEKLRAVLGRPNLRWTLAGAGSGAVVLVAAMLILMARPEATEHYMPLLSFNSLPYSGPMTVRGGSVIPGQEDFDAGMQAYLGADYKLATRLLKRAVGKSPDRAEWWLYLGVCGYLQREAGPTIKALSKADALAQGEIKLRARWFLAQAYLLAGDRKSAEPLLEWVIAQNREYSREAFTVLSRLRLEKTTGDTGELRLHLTSPSGGEVFLAGSTIIVSWNDEDVEPTEYYQIWLSMDGGVTFPRLLAARVDGAASSWDWDNPDVRSQSLALRLQAIHKDNHAKNAVSNPFAVIAAPVLAFQNPAHGERWRLGMAHEIKWTNYGSNPLSYSLELYRCEPPDTEWMETLAEGLPGTATRWMWQDTVAADDADPGDHYRFKLTGVYANGSVVSWARNNLALAARAVVTVDTLEPGAEWFQGDEITFKWECSEAGVLEYHVEISTSAVSPGTVLASGISGDINHWVWNSAGPSGTYFIRVFARFPEGSVRGELATPLVIQPRSPESGSTATVTHPAVKLPVLKQNYPNPFNTTTTIGFELPDGGPVRLSVYNELGQLVSRLIDAELGAGQHTVPFDGRSLASGVYVCRLEASGQVMQQRMLLAK